jgi:hypothetical protein
MNIDGKTMSVPEAFKLQLEKQGLNRKEGETMSDWSKRCQAGVKKTRYWDYAKEGKR